MRKLAVAALSFSAAIFAANFIFTRRAVLYAALLCALIGAAVLCVRLKSLRGLVIAAFAAAVGFAVFAAHYGLTVEKAHELNGQTRTVSFVLTDRPQHREGYSSVEARIDEEDLPHLNCLLYDNDHTIDALRAGDRIRAELRLKAADIRYGVHTNRYNARDVYLTATLRNGYAQIGHRRTLSSAASAAAAWIERRAESVFPADTAPFVKALLIGEKGDLYEDDALYVSLSRAGLMHIAAVSGMHVSYLVAFLIFLFGRGKRSSWICLPLIWAFVAVSGMSPSAIRAAFMQTMLLIAPLFNRENDPLTSLSAALAFLLLCNPFAAGNISLQLSFAAMLGIVLFAGPIQETLLRPFGEGETALRLRVPVGIVSCTLSVMIFSLPVSAAYFGYISLLSPLTNLLCLWAVPLCFVGGFAACAFASVPVLGKTLAVGVSLLTRYLIAIARFVSSLRFSVVCLPFTLGALCFGLFYLSLAAVFLFRLRPRWKLLIPVLTALFSLLLSQTALRLYYGAAKETLTAIDVGQGQCISVMTPQDTVLVDCGSTSYAEYNAGDCAAAYLKSCGKDRIDALVFTHLHEDHANGFERLSNLMEIGKVILPMNADDSDGLAERILFCAQKHQIEIEYAAEDHEECFGEIRLSLFASQVDGKGNERCMPVIVSVGSTDAVVTGDATAAKEKALARATELADVEILVVGHHGSKTSSCEEYLSAVSGQSAIISVGKNNYGQPSAEVLERLARFGYTVYRTDLDGNVEIRING